MNDDVDKVNTLLSVFQASLFSHLISVASNKSSSITYLGKIPNIQIELYKEEEHHEPIVESIQLEESIIPEAFEEQFDIPLITLTIHKHGKLLKKSISTQNDLGSLLGPCKGLRKSPAVPELLELQFEEIGPTIRKIESSKTPKILQRLNEEPKAKPARFLIPEEPKEPQDSPSTASLYGEVKATAYSQGGDGFVLHPGDFVSVLQFLNEFGLVECKWQGLKGLFPQDKIRVLTRASDSSSSFSAIASKQFQPSRALEPQSKPSKLVNRLMKKNH